MKRIIIFLLALILFGGIFTACSGGLRGGEITVKDAWARPGQAGDNSAVYFVIDNPGGPEDKLTQAASSAAAMVELHMTTTDSAGTSSMKHQENVPIPSRQRVIFEPGGMHVMMMNLRNELKPGDRMVVTLTFEQAGPIEVEAVVREP